MSHNQNRSQALKRAFADEEVGEGGTNKRSRFEEAPKPSEAIPKSETKTFAAKRLESLRANIKSAANRLKKPFKRAQSPKRIIIVNDSFRTVSEASSDSGNSQALSPINQRLSKIRKSSNSSSKTLTPFKRDKSERASIGRPLKTKSEKNNDDDDDTIIIIDDSPAPALKNRGTKTVNNNTLSSATSIVRDKVSPREKQGSPSKLADRLTKIRNAKNSSPKKAHTSKESPLAELNDIEKTHENIALPEVVSSLSKSDMVQNWMDSIHSRPSPKNETMSDSLTVNLDDTFLNKTELLTESQGEDSMEWDEVSEPKPPITNEPAEAAQKELLVKEKITCIVTDTNIFMHDLGKVKDLLTFLGTDNQKLKIYVPWMVFQELDYHKDRRVQPASSMALAAQKFINKYLSQPNSKIIGQSVQDVCQQMDLGKSPDDKIFACCLQAREKFESVILLSNDVNLCNKALTSNFKAYTAKDLLSKLKGSKFLKIKVKLQVLLSQIIFHCCKEAFGDACTKMDMLQGSPWPFEGCLKRFKKYWNTVFRSLLLKQCLKTVEELAAYNNRGDISDAKELDKFKLKIKEFLFYLQDIDQFNGPVKKVQHEIDTIEESASIL